MDSSTNNDGTADDFHAALSLLDDPTFLPDTSKVRISLVFYFLCLES